jgi:hypothetical protein
MNSLRHYINIISEAPIIPNTVSHSTDTFDLNKLNTIRGQYRGGTNAGQFSMVQHVNPHEVEKTGFLPIDKNEEPQDVYFNATRGLRGVNPFVPVIYQTTITKDPSSQTPNKQRSSYRMERLLMYDEVPLQLLGPVCFQIIESCISSIPHLKDTYKRLKTRYDKEIKAIHTGMDDIVQHDDEIKLPLKLSTIHNLKYLIVELTCNCIRRTVSSSQITSMNALKQVTKIINWIKQKYKVSDDIHEKNVMFRRTSFGVQLVITDPLANMKLL